MKKKLIVAVAVLLSGSLMFSSCIGSFGLTNKVFAWNKSVGDKWVNELVFLAFCILPVYEISVMVDALVINSIEFWSGSNPMADNVRHIDGENGSYLVESNANGYIITDEATQEKIELSYNSEDDSWSVDGITFLSFVDDNYVNVYAGNGEMIKVEKSEAGLMAYKAVTEVYMASK